MAKQLTPQEFDVFIKHVKSRFPSGLKCVCASGAPHTVIGLEASPNYVDGNISVASQTMPTVAVMCNHCFHVIRFAWLPIVGQGGGSNG
jgi:hypothetical protein